MRAISRAARTMTANRYEFVDSLRGMAILGVVVTHVGSMTLDGHPGIAALLRKVTVLGGMGVPLFYLVSAFTIMLMFTKRLGHEPAPLGSFFIRRFMRIAPVYWGGILLYTALYGFTSTRGWLEGPELWHYPLHILFLNMTNPFTPSSVVPGGWSISNEMIFYVLFPALFFLVNTPRKAVIFFAASVILSPLAELLAHALVASQFPSADAQQAKMFAYRWLPNQLSCFAAGFVFFHLFQRMKTVPASLQTTAAKAAVLSLLALLPILIVLVRKGPIQENHLWISWFLALAFAMYVYRWRLLVNGPLAWVGKVSFSCYIFHFAVIELIQRVLPTMSPAADFVVTLALTLPITLSLAWLSYRYYETFFMSLTSQIVEKYQARRQRSASAEA